MLFRSPREAGSTSAQSSAGAGARLLQHQGTLPPTLPAPAPGSPVAPGVRGGAGGGAGWARGLSLERPQLGKKRRGCRARPPAPHTHSVRAAGLGTTWQKAARRGSACPVVSLRTLSPSRELGVPLAPARRYLCLGPRVGRDRPGQSVLGASGPWLCTRGPPSHPAAPLGSSKRPGHSSERAGPTAHPSTASLHADQRPWVSWAQGTWSCCVPLQRLHVASQEPMLMS